MANLKDSESREFQKDLSDPGIKSSLKDIFDGSDDFDNLDQDDDKPLLGIEKPSERPLNKSPKYSYLILAAILLGMLGGWWYVADYPKKDTQQEANLDTPQFVEPTINNTIIIEDDFDQDAFDENIKVQNSRVAVPSSMIGRGEYFLELQECVFDECTNHYETLLQKANLPINKQTSYSYYKFIRLVSKKATSSIPNVDNIKAMLMQVDPIYNSATMPIEIINKQLKIGLFTTLQQAKATKTEIEKALSEMEVALDLEVEEATLKQQVTKVYSGPYQNQQTAKQILAELSTAFPLDSINIVKIP